MASVLESGSRGEEKGAAGVAQSPAAPKHTCGNSPWIVVGGEHGARHNPPGRPLLGWCRVSAQRTDEGNGGRRRVTSREAAGPPSAAPRLAGAEAAALHPAPKAAPNEEGRLVAGALGLVRRHLRCGYRRIWALLRRKGRRVNRECVRRLWREQGLRVPRRQRKKRRLGPVQSLQRLGQRMAH